jgi:hypothetical protein
MTLKSFVCSRVSSTLLWIFQSTVFLVHFPLYTVLDFPEHCPFPKAHSCFFPNTALDFPEHCFPRPFPTLIWIFQSTVLLFYALVSPIWINIPSTSSHRFFSTFLGQIRIFYTSVLPLPFPTFAFFTHPFHSFLFMSRVSQFHRFH